MGDNCPLYCVYLLRDVWSWVWQKARCFLHTRSVDSSTAEPTGRVINIPQPSFFIFSFKETLIWIKPTQTCCTQFRHTKKLVETKLNRSLPKFRKVEGQEFVKFGCKVNQRYNTMLLEADFFWQTCLSTAIWLYHCVSALRFHTISSLFWPPRFWSVSLAMWLHLHLLHLF